MERVLGIGGFFFRATDPNALAAWYAKHLGIDPVPKDYDTPSWQTDAGDCVFAPFGEKSWDSEYLGPLGFGINFRVRDLDAMVAQLREAGIAVKVDPETYPNGRFAQLADPEGNAIQLWQPA